ncbi:MAG: glycosyltransferase family 39 protein [Patescibacteria group bacterium]|nr:glycosyltransferase family 39 protein [Patescibacteria group bacterium]
MKRHIEKYLIYIILFVASILRLKNISKRDFWCDEAFTGIFIKENFANMMNMIINDVHPPLYYIFVKFFAFFFNYSVFGIRLYSAIFGVLGVLAVYLFTKEFFNKKSAIYASLITAISPFAIQYSQEARMYSMFGFLIIIATYFFTKGVKTHKTKYYIFWGVFLGIASLTHYMGIIFFPIYLLIAILQKLSKDKKLSIKFLISFKQLIIGYAIASIIFLPWIKIFYGHLKNSQGGLSWIKPANFSDIFTNITIFIFGSKLGALGMPQLNEFYWISEFSIILLITVLFSSIITWLIIKINEKNKIFTLLILSFGFISIIYFLSLIGKQYFVSRYFLPSAYFLFIIIGFWLSKIKFRFAVIFLALYVIFLNLIIPLEYSAGWNKLKNNIDKYERKNLYLLNSFDYLIAKYYFGADNLILYNIDFPEYNPEDWACIGSSLKRTEKFFDFKNDKNGLIISDEKFKNKIKEKKEFNVNELKLIDEYKNILIYKFNNTK